MSDADIAKGSRGINELTKALSSMKVGIICLSPENLDTPWLLYEAGALSKEIGDSSRLCTYLLDKLDPEDVKPSLGMFQATKAHKEDSKKLIQTINVSVSDEPLGEEDLDEIFEAMWPSLETTIKSLPHIEPTKAVKRKADDMIIEILEIVRAEANRRQVELLRMQPMSGNTLAQVEAVKTAILRQEKFLGECIGHAKRWELERGEMRLYFPVKNRALAEMLLARDPMARLRAIATKVLGTPVDVHIEIEDEPTF